MDITPSLDNFPPDTQDHIKVALSTFLDYLHWPQHVGAKTLEELEVLLGGKCSEFPVEEKERGWIAHD